MTLDFLAGLFIGALIPPVLLWVLSRKVVSDPDEPPDWSAEDPAVVAAARAHCALPPEEGPCLTCMTQTKRVLRAYQEAQPRP